MLQLGRRRLCLFTSPYVCARCLATSHPTSIIPRRPIVAAHHVRTLSTTLACREAAAPGVNSEPTPAPATDVTAKEPKSSPAAGKKKKKKKKQPSKESGKEETPPESDTQRQLKVLQGALQALKNVLSTRGIDVGQVPSTHLDSSTPTPPKESDSKAKSKSKSKSKPKAEKDASKASDVVPSETTQPDPAAEPQASVSKAPHTAKNIKGQHRRERKRERKRERRREHRRGLGVTEQEPPQKSGADPRRTKRAANLKAVRSILAKEMDSQDSVQEPAPLRISSGETVTPRTDKKKGGTKPPATSDVQPDKVRPGELSLIPIEGVIQPAVPALSYGLERVLFNPGVYQLQDPRSRVYNFDPYLSEIMPVNEFDFNALKQYVTSSKDTTLISIAKDHQKKYTGSTSSMTSMLAHFHYLLSAWRNINSSMLSRSFDPESVQYTQIMRAPAATFLHWKDGTYAIDADKEFDTANILSMLGKSMEKLLTLPKDDYERYRRANSDQITEEERNAEEAFHYTGFQDFMMRSQLDAHDPRVPGTGMFDLKTRAVISIRMDAAGYEKGLGYEIRERFGQWASFEREYYDMIRSAFLKYSLQVRMGRMDGIFVAFHNTQRIFGFQYIPLEEMDLALHGTSNKELGDREFKVSLKLLNELLNRATQKWPEQSLRLHFETRASKGAPYMYFFATPTTPEEIAAVQGASKASVEAFERNILGLVKSAEEEGEPQIEVIDKNKDDLNQVETSAAQEIDSFAIWQEARQMVEEAIGDDEHGVGLVREAIGDALEESGILRARSLTESREYVDTLLEALIGRAPSDQEAAAVTDPIEEEVVDEDELEEQVSEKSQDDSTSECPPALQDTETAEPAAHSSTPEAAPTSEGLHLGHETTSDLGSTTNDRDTHSESPEIEVTSTSLEVESHVSQLGGDAPESQLTSREDMKEEPPVTTRGGSAVTTDESLASTPSNEEEDYEEIDEDEDTSETELEGDNETKEYREDSTSSTLEPLKSLILRMARRIDEQTISDTNATIPQDDASKLQEFERILGRLISQSKTDNVEGDSDHDPQGQYPPPGSNVPDNAVAGASMSDVAVSALDTQGEIKEQLAGAEPIQPDQPASSSELLALTLTVKNRVNGKYVDRPGELSEGDDWTVEYEIREVEQRRAKTIYEMLKQRRRKTLTSTDKEQEWYRMFRGNLSKYTQEGREFREREIKRTQGQPVYTVHTTGPLEWEEVFGRQPKNSQSSDEGASASIADKPDSVLGEDKGDASG